MTERSPGRPAAITGTLARGRGEAAGFTRLDWVRQQMIGHVGIDPHPGTYNVQVSHEASRAAWRAVRAGDASVIEPPAGSGFCRGFLHPMRVAGTPAAAVVPDVADYTEDTIELVSAIGLREHHGHAEGEQVALEPWRPIRARAIVFDVDGTLVDSVAAYFEIARVAAALYDYPITMQHVKTALESGRSFWNEVVPQDAPDRDARMKAMVARARAAWPSVVNEHARLFPNLATTLRTLADAGFTLGIVTAGDGQVISHLRAAGLADAFRSVVTGKDVAKRKPDPEGIVKCVDELGFAPDEVVYVGDTPLDVQASRGAGVHVFGVLTGASSSATLTRAGADRLLATLDGIERLVEPVPG